MSDFCFDSRTRFTLASGLLLLAISGTAQAQAQSSKAGSANASRGVAASANAAKVATPAPAPAPKNDSIRVLVAAEQESTLAAQMTGRIDQLNVQLGASIKSGQSLLRFVCEEQEAHLKMAKAEFYGAQQTYESKIKLQAMQSVSELEVQQAAAAAEKAKAQIQLYQAQIKLCHINAPFSGRVTKLHVKAYESVNTGQPLIDIVNDRKLKLQLHLPSTWLSWVKVGSSFTLQIDETGKNYEGRVRRINGKVDAVSQSVEIEGEVAGDTEGLLPGMSGQAQFKR